MGSTSRAITAFNNARRHLNIIDDIEFGMQINMKFDFDGSFYRDDAIKLIEELKNAERELRVVRKSLE